jgi:hypothetical protein
MQMKTGFWGSSQDSTVDGGNVAECSERHSISILPMSLESWSEDRAGVYNTKSAKYAQNRHIHAAIHVN